MKLHLPKLLRNALLACISAVAGVATSTVGTATMTGAALAVALANQQAQAAGPSLGVTTGGNFFAGNYTFTFTLTEGCLSAEDTTDVLGLYWGSYNSNNYNSNGFVLNWEPGGAITLSVGDGRMSNVGTTADVAEITEETTFTALRGATFATILTMGETYTITNVGANGTQTVTLSGGTIESETVTYNGNMDGGNGATVMGSVGNAAYNIVTPNPNAATWDINWGDDVLNQAPANLTAVSPVSGNNYLYNADRNKTGEVVHVNLNSTGAINNSIIFGGTDSAQSNLTASVWIKATSGTYTNIIGGSRSQWENGTATCVFTGDTHILIDGATVGAIIGGNWGDKDANLVGDTYITVKSGNVTGNIAGSSVNAHMLNALHTGDTHVFIYTPLSGNGYIAGGSSIGTNQGGCATLTGNTNVTIDLSEYAGEAVTFAKNIAAGHYYTGPKANGNGDRSISGSTNLLIDAADNVTFSGRVVGGTYMSNGYENMNAVGTVNMTIKGGTYTGPVAGGHFMDATLEKMTMKADVINVNLEGGTIAGTVYGGHVDFVSQSAGHAITTEAGTINVTLDGATVGTLVGGGFTQRDNGGNNAVMTQGSVNVSLLSGTVTEVYAAGEQKHNTKWTTESVTVNVGDAIVFGENALVTSGYKFHFPDNEVRCDSTITGDRTLNFVGGNREYTGSIFTGFNKLGVTKAETTAILNGYSYEGEVSKSGVGALGLAGESTMTSLTVTEGALTLGAGARLTGDLILSDNTGLNTGDGTFTLTGALTLGTGLSITGDVAPTGVITLMSGVTALNGVTLADGSVAASTVFSSINGSTEISGYKLTLTNGVLTLVEGEPIIPTISLTWAPEDAATNHGTWQDGSKFNDAGGEYLADGKYDVTFGEVTNTANPEKVQIGGEVTPNSMVVDAGAGTYEFYIGGNNQSGITAAEDGIQIASGTAIFRAGTLAMTEQTTVSVAGTLALDNGAMVDQDKVNVVLYDGGTLRWLAGNTTDYSLNGGLAISSGAATFAAGGTSVTLDIGANNVQLKGEVQGAVTGTTINIIGTAGQTLQAAGGVFGTAGLHLNGVNLGLVSGAQYGNNISNTAGGHAESITIAPAATAADPANTETILSGDNSGFTGTASIGAGTTLVLASTNALGANMALTGTGNVAFSDGGATGPVTHASLNTDDVYTGTTTVRNNAILNWGEATTARSGGIILDNGSTLVLNCGVANAITDGLATAGLAKGGVTITSLTDDDGEIIPVQWNSTGKTYTGLTTISADTIVETNTSIAQGNAGQVGRVYLSDASSILRITDTTWDGSWTAGNNVYGAGTILLQAADNAASKTFTDVLLDGIVAAGDGNSVANVQIAAGTTLHQTGAKGGNTDAKRDILNNISRITVEDGATFSIAHDFSKNSYVTHTWSLAGEGVTDAEGNKLGAVYNGTENSWVSADIVLTDDTLIKSMHNLIIEGNTINGNSHDLSFINAADKSVEFNGSVSNIDTWSLSGGKYWLNATGSVSNVNTLEVADATTLVFKGNNKTPGVTNIDLKDGAVLSYHAESASNILKLGTVTANNTDDTKHATIQLDAWNHGIIDIAALNGSGELHVRSYGDSSTPCGAIVVNDGDFNGTIQVRQSNAGSTRRVVLATDDTDVFADAVINFGQTASDVVGAGLVIGGAEDNVVKVAGISSIPLTTVDDYTYTTGSTDNRLDAVTASTAAQIAARTMLVSGGSTNLFANAQTTASTVDGYGDGIDRVLQVTGAGSYDYTGTVGSNLTVKMSGTGKQTLSGKLNADSGYVAAGGTLAISGKGKTGAHSFQATTGGVLDMEGYAADTNATLEDSIVAAGGVVKNLTLGEGMTLSQTDAASKLAGALTLAGGDVVFGLGNENNAYQVSTKYACEAGTTLTITDATMVFTPDALLGYIDANNAEANGNYKLMTGLTSIEGIANLKSNFSEESRAEHTFAVVDEADGTKSLVLHVEGNAATLAWTGETTNAEGKKMWDLKSTDNWSDGNDQTVDQFYSDDKVTFSQVMGDADNDPNTADVAIDQVVTVADAGVKIGTMTVSGGNYTFEGGAISSVKGMGDIAITGGNVTFNNSITTDGDMRISNAPVTFNAANSWTGETVLSGTDAVVKVTNAQGLSTTKTTINNAAELQLAVDGTMTTSEMVLNSGNIYAQGDVTVNKLVLTNDAPKSLNVDTGKTMTVTVDGNQIRNTLFINEYKDVAGTVNMTVSNALTDMDNITVGKGALNATFNGNVAQGNTITYKNNTSGSMTFKGTAGVGKLDIGNADVTMNFMGAATTGEIWVNGTWTGDAATQKKLVAVFDSTATVAKITGNGGAMDLTFKGAAVVTGDIASGTCDTELDFQGGLTGATVTVGDKTTTMGIGANSTLSGAVTVNNAGKLTLTGGSGKTLTTPSVVLSGAQSNLEVSGGMTLTTASITGVGTLKLTGSGLSTSAATVGVNVVTENGGTLTGTNAAGISMDTGKTISLTGAGTTTLVGTWTLEPTTVQWADNSTTVLATGANSTIKLTGSTSMKDLSIVGGSSLVKAGNDDITLTAEHLNLNGTIGEGVTARITGHDGNNISWISDGAVARDLVVDVDDNLTLGDVVTVQLARSTSDSVTLNRGRLRMHESGNLTVKRGIVVNGAEAILADNPNSAGNVVTDADVAYDITLQQGKLEAFYNYRGTVQVDDETAIRTYDMGQISDQAQVHIGSLNTDEVTGEYSRLTNVRSLKLAGCNTVTLIDAMETGESVFGTTGAVTLADDADLHIDINSVLADLLTATDTIPAVTTFNLGGDLSALQNHDNVVFDTALSLFNLKADFGTDGLLTLTQYAPAGNIYQSTVEQGDSTDWNAKGKEVYDSAEGYSAILIDKDTEIDLTAEEPAAAQNGLGMVLNNLIGTAGSTLSITGDGNDLVTISNTVADAEYNSMAGSIAVTDADVQILHTESMGAAAPVVNTNSTYIVKGSLTLEGGELKLAAGKLQLDGAGNRILDGVTVADDGQAQLILNGTTTLGGSIDHAAAADMLEATGVTLPAVAALATQPAHILLGATSTTTLADGAMVESGVIIDGAAGSVVTVAEDASATISNGAELSGAALELAEGTTLTVDTTETSGKLSLTGADIEGTLASSGPADASITVTQAPGGTSTYAGDMNGYTGDLVLKGAGVHRLADDAANADIIARGTNVTITPDADDVISLRSLEVDADSTLTMDAAIDGTTANKKVNTTEGVTLAGDMNLTANLSTVREGGLIFTGGTVEVQDGASINLVVNSVSDRVANALLSEGETSVTLAEDATGFADVVITSNDQRVNKYLHNAVVRVEDGKLVLTGETVNGETADFHQQLAETENGQAGADLLDNAYGSSMKAINDAESDVKAVLNHLETLIVSGNTAGTDETLAAVAGASSAVLGMAASADVDRQLQAIRNRTTIMGVDQSVVQEGMPYFNAWINAEGDFSELSDNGTEGGYELSSWGGTVGFDVDITPTFTAGMALTAMYGDLTVNGVDKSKGDMDTYYISAFARYAASAWTHTFVGTVGMSDLSMKRTVNYGGGSYETQADTDGMSFGLMYEVGRVFSLSEDGTTCLQPMFNVAWRHTTISGYTEKSSGDASVKVDDQTMDVVTFGLGARLQTIVGEDMFNRTSIFECRVLAKADTGDTSCSTNTALAAYNNIDAEVNSAERGSVGVEAGAGLTIPVGDEGGSLFMDASIEVRSDYTNVNATVGYRVNF